MEFFNIAEFHNPLQKKWKHKISVYVNSWEKQWKNPAIQNFNMTNNLLTLNKEYIKKQEQSLFSMVLHFLLRSYLL